MKEFRCGDVVAGCDAVFTAQQASVILGEVACHLETEHCMSEVPPEVIVAVLTHLREPARAGRESSDFAR